MSNPNTSALVDKLWNYCNLLRDEGLSYGDYVQQLTNLLFLKMAEERKAQNGHDIVPTIYSWETLRLRKGAALKDHYETILKELGKSGGTLGVIFRDSQNKIQKPAMLERLIVDLIDRVEWSNADADLKGDAYEGLLEKNAQDTKSGAGQYFTPRPLIDAMVDVVRPEPGQTVCDPACGTGGFLIAAHDYVTHHNKLDRDEARHLRFDAVRGWEIVANTARLCAMNFLLHGIGDAEGESLVTRDDALQKQPGVFFDMVLSNPPFGKKSSIKVINEEGKEERETTNYTRQDFWATTSNKQLNFVQHIYTLLKDTGRAALVLPDNVLFEGGAGETIRKRLLNQCDVHTLVRLPTGIFYAQGVKANILFFDNRPAGDKPQTERLWVYDLRTNKNFTLKTNPLKRGDLDEFVACYNPENRFQREATWSEENPEGRWRSYSYAELIARDKVSLDLFWLRDDSLEDSANLPDPDELAEDIITDLQAALEKFRLVVAPTV